MERLEQCFLVCFFLVCFFDVFFLCFFLLFFFCVFFGVFGFLEVFQRAVLIGLIWNFRLR